MNVQAPPELLCEVDVPDGVVQDLVSAEVIAVGNASDADERQVFAHGARHCIDHAEASYCKCDNHTAHALGPCIAVCCIPCKRTCNISSYISSRCLHLAPTTAMILSGPPQWRSLSHSPLLGLCIAVCYIACMQITGYSCGLHLVQQMHVRRSLPHSPCSRLSAPFTFSTKSGYGPTLWYFERHRAVNTTLYFRMRSLGSAHDEERRSPEHGLGAHSRHQEGEKG